MCIDNVILEIEWFWSRYAFSIDVSSYEGIVILSIGKCNHCYVTNAWSLQI